MTLTRFNRIWYAICFVSSSLANIIQLFHVLSQKKMASFHVGNGSVTIFVLHIRWNDAVTLVNNMSISGQFSQMKTKPGAQVVTTYCSQSNVDIDKVWL